MNRIEKTKKLHDSLGRNDEKCYAAKRKKLGKNLMIGEKVLVLAERIKKESCPSQVL